MKLNEINCYLIVRSVVCALIIGFSVNYSVVAQQSDNIDRMAYEAMQSLSQANLPSSVKTVAIGNLIQAPDDLYKDLTRHLFETRKFKVISRRQLTDLLEEFKFTNTSGLIDPKEMKELKLHGIDAFIFGRKLQTDLPELTFVIKLVDVNTGTILWGRVLGKQKDEILTETAAQVKRIEAASLRSSNSVRTIAFWRIENHSDDRNLDINGLMDVMAIELSKSRRFKIIDRQNLEILVKEQEFTQSGLVNPKDIKEFGTQYGINGFIFGTVTDGNREAISVMLKLVEAETATIAWAERLETPVSKEWYKENGKSRQEIVDEVVSKLRKESNLRMSDVETISIDIQIKNNDEKKNTSAVKIADEIGEAILKRTRFKWIDRKNYLGVLVDEQIRSGSGFVGRSKLELKALDIDAFLYGELSQEDKTTWVLYLEAIKVDTGEIVSVIQATGKLSHHELHEGRTSVWVQGATNLRTGNSWNVYLQESNLSSSNQLSSLLNVSVNSENPQVFIKPPHFRRSSRSDPIFSLVRIEGDYRTGRFETTPIETKFVPANSATMLQLQISKGLIKGNYAIHENQNLRQGKNWFFRVDGGEALFPMKNATALALHPDNINTVYAGTADGVYKTTDGGQTWQPFGLRNNKILVLEIQDDQLYAATDEKYVYDTVVYLRTNSKSYGKTYSDSVAYKTDLRGANWRKATYTETYKVDFNNRTRMRYVRVSEPDDPGLVDLIERHFGSAPLAYTPFVGEAIYASTKTGIYKSIDNGNSWGHSDDIRQLNRSVPRLNRSVPRQLTEYWKHSDEIGQLNRSVPRQLTGYKTQRRNLINQISENEDHIRKHPAGIPLLGWGILSGLVGAVAHAALDCDEDERVPDPANPGETICIDGISPEDRKTILTIMGVGVAAGIVHELIWAAQRSLKKHENDQLQKKLHRLDQQAYNETPYSSVKSTLKSQLKKISLNYRPQFGGVGVQYSVQF